MKSADAYESANNSSEALRSGPERLLAYVGPPSLAFTAVWYEPALTTLARTHQAVLPLATMLLLAALLQRELRQYLIVTLCYGVAFLAVRDTARVMQVPLPPALDYDWFDALRPIGLWCVAVLAAISGVAETAKPGTVWARRCYFGAAALYFSGIGIMNFAANHSWRGVVLCFTGATALVGCFMAHRVVASEAEPEDEVLTDEQVQQAREARHNAALKTKEWRESIISIMDDCDGAVTGSAIKSSHPK